MVLYSSRSSSALGWPLAVVAGLAMTASYIDRQALSHLAPTIREALNIDHAGYGVLVGAFSLAYLMGGPLAGRLINRAGARNGLAIALILWSLISALHAIAPSLLALLVLRIALGATEAAGLPGSARAVSRSVRPGDRSANYAMLFTGSSVGAVIAGPLIIGLKIALGWKLAIVAASLLGVLLIPFWFAVTGGERRHLFKPHGEPSARVDEVPWRDILRERAVQRTLFLVFMSAPAIMFVHSWFAQLLVERLYESQDDIWRYLWVPPLLFDCGAVGFGWMASRRERLTRGSSRTDFVLVGAALIAALAIVPFVDSAISAIALAGVAMVGAGALYVLTTSDMLVRVPAGVVSRAVTCVAAAQAVAYVISAPAVGLVLDRAHSYSPVLIAVGLIGLPASWAWALWPMGASRAHRSSSLLAAAEVAGAPK